MRKSIFLFCGLALLLICVTARADLNVRYQDQDFKVRTEEMSSIEYASLADLNYVLGGSSYWNPVNKKLVLTIADRQFKFVMFSPYLQVDRAVYNLTYPVELKSGDLYAPLTTLVDILNRCLAFQIDWKPGDRLLEIVPKELDITGVQVSQKVNGLLLEIYLTQPLEYEIFSAPDNWVHLNFFAAKINPDQIQSQPIDRVVQEVKAYQFENSCQLSFKLRRAFNDIQKELREDPLRLRISLSDTTQNNQIRPQVLATNGAFEDNPIDLIVIDAGHGGEDTGAKGPGGLLEKDVALAIAKKTRDILKDKGFEVVLTRETDVFIPLGERAAFANRKEADLFISIHANAAKRTRASGSETYFLAQAKNDEARAVAALENASIRFEQPQGGQNQTGDLDFILTDMAQNEFLKESQALAFLIQDRMERHLPIPNRGVDQAGFVVLNQAYMPAVLVETAFISNPNEAKLLNQDKFQSRVAQALAEAVAEFKQKYETINRVQ